jgi:glucose-6-phosphate isomerase
MNNTLYFTAKVNENFASVLSEESNHIGFYHLPETDTTPYKEYAKNVTQKDIVVVGIGGSALGSIAIHHFLGLNHKFEKNIHFIETTDPLVLQQKVELINLDDALFLIISKSGTTVETIASLKYLQTFVPISKENYAVITDKGSALEEFASAYDLKVFNIPDNVGGRFSVLSAVGLVPLAIIGVDIDALLEGAKRIKDSFFENSGYCEKLLTKATYYAQKSNSYNINCLFSYSEVFREFNAWYVQLWGESLGKKQRHSQLHVGLTPVGLIGPTDQHSFLQLIVDGKRDKTVTVIKVKDFHNHIKIPDVTLPALEKLDMLNGHGFSELINMQADAMIESLESLEFIPVDVIEIEDVNEAAIGEMMFYYELLTALVAQMLDINAYDQPGVEMGKIILKEKMGE